MSAVPDRNALRERLRRFLEIHNAAKILEADDGSLKMHILHAKTRNSKPKDKLINYKLLRLNERLLGDTPWDDANAHVCEFLVAELEKYVARQG